MVDIIISSINLLIKNIRLTCIYYLINYLLLNKKNYYQNYMIFQCILLMKFIKNKKIKLNEEFNIGKFL